MELGELGGVLPVAGAHRNRPAWVVAAVRERGSWGREERGRETEREEAFGGVGWALSRGLFFLLLSRWMDGCGEGGELDGWICATSSIRGTNISTNRNQAHAIVFSLLFFF